MCWQELSTLHFFAVMYDNTLNCSGIVDQFINSLMHCIVLQQSRNHIGNHKALCCMFCIVLHCILCTLCIALVDIVGLMGLIIALPAHSLPDPPTTAVLYVNTSHSGILYSFSIILFKYCQLFPAPCMRHHMSCNSSRFLLAP